MEMSYGSSSVASGSIPFDLFCRLPVYLELIELASELVQALKLPQGRTSLGGRMLLDPKECIWLPLCGFMVLVIMEQGNGGFSLYISLSLSIYLVD